MGRQTGHIVELDSLRGVAAITVVFGHFYLLWREAGHTPHWVEQLFRMPPFFLLVAGHAAVVLFFLLSGFVLTLPVLRDKTQSYPQYVIRRVCRIYLPYLVALSISLIACAKLYGRPLYGQWFQHTWVAAPHAASVLQHVVFIGNFNTVLYNPPIWSLVHEMRISLIFPLLCLAALRLNTRIVLLISACLPLIADLLAGHSILPETYARSVGYCGMFLIGVLIARHQDAIRERFQQIPRFARWAVFFLALAFYLYPGASTLPLHLRGMQLELVTAIGGSYIIIMAVMHAGFSNLLRRKPLRFLGKVSYSIYLIHFPLLFALAILCSYENIPLLVAFPVFVTATLVLSNIFYTYIEKPSIWLGKTLTQVPRPSPEAPVSA